MRRAVLLAGLLGACGPATGPQTRVTSPPPPPPCTGAAQLTPPPLDVPGYPIARVPLDSTGHAARVAELAAAHPGWRFDVDEYGAVRSVAGEPTYPASAPLDQPRLAQLLATLGSEGLVPRELHAAPAAVGELLVDPSGAVRGSARMFATPQKVAFIDVGFPPSGPNFPLPPGAHMLTQAELLDRYDPAHDHVAELYDAVAPMPCDPAPGYHCSSGPESKPPSCVSVRELGFALVILGTGDGHQRLVYSAASNDQAMQLSHAGMPLCIDAFTGAALPWPCRPY